jgi:hypothetical protein
MHPALVALVADDDAAPSFSLGFLPSLGDEDELDDGAQDEGDDANADAAADQRELEADAMIRQTLNGW